MLTINADQHPLLSRFHKPFDEEGRPEEKRTVVLLRESRFDAWLDAAPEEVSDFLSTFDADELTAFPAPLQPTKKSNASKQEQMQLRLD